MNYCDTHCIDLAPWAAPVKMKRHLINPKTPVFGSATVQGERPFFEPVQILGLRLEKSTVFVSLFYKMFARNQENLTQGHSISDQKFCDL